LVKLSETLGRQSSQDSEFLLLLKGPLFEQMETGPHHFTGVAKAALSDLLFNELVKVICEIHIPRGHHSPQDRVKLDYASRSSIPWIGNFCQWGLWRGKQ
jgi:hypothetical protein